MLRRIFDVRPAVNRQPGYRRVDSQSGYQQTQKNLKTNSNHKTRHDRTTERAKAQTDDVQTERAIDEFNRFAQLEDTQTEPWRTTQENRWTKWANVHQHLAATHYNIHNHKNVDVTQQFGRVTSTQSWNTAAPPIQIKKIQIGFVSTQHDNMHLNQRNNQTNARPQYVEPMRNPKDRRSTKLSAQPGKANRISKIPNTYPFNAPKDNTDRTTQPNKSKPYVQTQICPTIEIQNMNVHQTTHARMCKRNNTPQQTRNQIPAPQTDYT